MAKDVGSGKPRHEKLSLQPGQVVCVDDAYGEFDDDVRADVVKAGCVVGAIDDAACVFVAVDGTGDLVRVDAARAAMDDDCAIWVVWPKGVKTINENLIREHALRGDLVDVKVMSWSSTRSGLRLVVRKELRKTTKKKTSATTKKTAQKKKATKKKATKKKAQKKKATKKTAQKKKATKK